MAYAEGIRAAEAVGERQLVAYLQHNLGTLEASAGDPHTVRTQLTRSLEAKRVMGDRVGTAALDAARREGRTLSPEATTARVRAVP